MSVGMIPVRVLLAILANKKLISNGRQFIKTPKMQFFPKRTNTNHSSDKRQPYMYKAIEIIKIEADTYNTSIYKFKSWFVTDTQILRD